jgi:hypothetical protein
MLHRVFCFCSSLDLKLSTVEAGNVTARGKCGDVDLWSFFSCPEHSHVCSYCSHESFQRFSGVRSRCGEVFKCSRIVHVEETCIFFEFRTLKIFCEELRLQSRDSYRFKYTNFTNVVAQIPTNITF